LLVGEIDGSGSSDGDPEWPEFPESIRSELPEPTPGEREQRSSNRRAIRGHEVVAEVRQQLSRAVGIPTVNVSRASLAAANRVVVNAATVLAKVVRGWRPP
jgi:hypothetical protein